MNKRALVLALGAALLLPLLAQAQSAKLGAVVMHGKGGSPGKQVDELARTLESQGILVSNLEMPWSGRRDYDVGVKTAEQEITEGLQALRAKGATAVFVIGHSQGGAFALHYGSQQKVDGVVAVAPGGSTGSPAFREQLKEPLAQARELVAQGKGEEKARLSDYEGSKGRISLAVKPALYLEWFDPEGAMNQEKASRNLLPGTPVLYVAPTGDYAGLQRIKQVMFNALPANSCNKMIEPRASHMDAPRAAGQDIARWMQEVVGAGCQAK